MQLAIWSLQDIQRDLFLDELEWEGSTMSQSYMHYAHHGSVVPRVAAPLVSRTCTMHTTGRSYHGSRHHWSVVHALCTPLVSRTTGHGTTGQSVVTSRGEEWSPMTCPHQRPDLLIRKSGGLVVVEDKDGQHLSRGLVVEDKDGQHLSKRIMLGSTCREDWWLKTRTGSTCRKG